MNGPSFTLVTCMSAPNTPRSTCAPSASSAAHTASYAGSLTAHVLESIAHHAHLTLHVRLLGGRDPHHIVEAQFKAVARALRDAIAFDPRETGVPSTKGAL